MNYSKLIAFAAAAALTPVMTLAQDGAASGGGDAASSGSGTTPPARRTGDGSYNRFGGSLDTVVRRDSGGAGTNWGVQPGGARSSRLTWSVKEQISPNVAATAVLEGAFSPDSGAGGTPPVPSTTAGFQPSFTFNRTAHVGVGDDSWGYITLGRQFTPIQATTSGPVNDPFGGAWLGGIATIYNKTSGASNAIVYSYGYSAEAMLRPAPRNGLGVSIMYAPGEEPSPLTKAGNQYGANVTYGGSNWWAGYAIHRQMGNSATLAPANPSSEAPKITYQWVGGAYEIWRARISLGLNTGRNSTSTLDRKNWSLGLQFPVGERGTVRFLHGRANDETATNGDFRTTQAAYMYDLSKRTGVYVVWGNVDNSANASVVLSGAIGTVPRGATARSLAFGIKHVF